MYKDQITHNAGIWSPGVPNLLKVFQLGILRPNGQGQSLMKKMTVDPTESFSEISIVWSKLIVITKKRLQIQPLMCFMYYSFNSPC